MDGEVGEILGRTSGRAPCAPGDKDQFTGFQGVFLSGGLYEPRTRYPYKDDIHLVVDVLPDAPPEAEADQVGVKVGACF